MHTADKPSNFRVVKLFGVVNSELHHFLALNDVTLDLNMHQNAADKSCNKLINVVWVFKVFNLYVCQENKDQGTLYQENKNGRP